MNDIEKKARDLLAVEYEQDGMVAAARRIRAGQINRPTGSRQALRAIATAISQLDGYVLVPVEPTAAMVEAAAEAYMPFGDMGLALQVAIAACPEASP